MNQLEKFTRSFEALTGNNPFEWQKRFYKRLLKDNNLAVVNIPTGLGKTSIIPIWLVALAESYFREPPSFIVPRRLVYIVNRRTVVDQATDVVQQMRHRLLDPENDDWNQYVETLRSLANQLRQLARTDTYDVPLAISTLRGELADNEEWKADPARPAIIIGTVDMIGSKLLFSGYGDSFRLRPHHAGLIGQDTLIVLDEAHLTPAFGKLLREVADAQKNANETRPIRVLELSATPSTAGNGRAFTLELEDEEDEIVQKRLNAVKSLHVHDVEPKDPDKTLAESALTHEEKASKVLIYVRSPEDAQKVVNELQKKLKNQREHRVALLTGTIRGHERDQLVKRDPVYHALLNHESSVEQTVYLVSTSAGEVGIDLHAHHMVCDLTTLDSMIQRLGRVNRRGQRFARVDVMIPREDKEKRLSDFDKAIQQARLVLEQLPKREHDGYDASPKALQSLLQNIGDEKKRQAFTPQPTIVPTTDILFDAWSLTGVRQSIPGLPEVASYLHGLTSDPPETFVVWRNEVEFLSPEQVDSEALQEWFHACRIEAREKLRDRTDRVFKQLKNIDKRRQAKTVPVVLLSERSDAELLSLSELIKRRKDWIAYRTIVLPVETGGLTQQGTLDGSFPEPAEDVAEYDGTRMRFILSYRDELYWAKRLREPGPTGNNEEHDIDEGKNCKSARDAAERIGRENGMVVSCLISLRQPADGAEDEVEARYLLLLAKPKHKAFESPESAGYQKPPTLDEHTKQVVNEVRRIGEALGLVEILKQALIIAAKWHDRGKDRRRWQRAIFNTSGEALAKPGPRGMNARVLGGYRHEFGSLLEAAVDPEICNHLERGLILHLIAAHHGRARPHFEPNALDIEQHTTQTNEDAAHEVMRRFARLQERFGHWGLAWLESLLRCADASASQQIAQSTSLEVQA